MPSVYHVAGEPVEPEVGGMEIDLVDAARKLIDKWKKEKEMASAKAAYYTGAIDGINLYLEALGRESSGEPGSTERRPEGKKQ